jgi:uncharacterized membrane protein YoaT (DUF817 family)
MCNILICSKIYITIFLHKYYDMCTHFFSQLKINVFEHLWVYYTSQQPKRCNKPLHDSIRLK